MDAAGINNNNIPPAEPTLQYSSSSSSSSTMMPASHFFFNNQYDPNINSNMNTAVISPDMNVITPPSPNNNNTSGSLMISNMKIITSIYLNCRPDSKDEWIAPTNAETEVEEALTNLRTLIKIYNESNYSSQYRDPHQLQQQQHYLNHQNYQNCNKNNNSYNNNNNPNNNNYNNNNNNNEIIEETFPPNYT
ncbi:hypothetical protein Glove_151g174 [Diversispora epigaea]|uniref:Far11/STRP C-terminal domain-containing protein n=1 Tax=Diversispora epigaea TaxID=1348612 RepID=A0A397IVQ2_9GLOM|nr:hypothetical protein Glove_151g174 [Diversispora epigaea]